MNLLLIEAGELDAGDRVELTGRRAEHLCRVLKVEVGDRVRAGVVGGGRGEARVEEVAKPPRASREGPRVTLRLAGLDAPPPPSDIDLIVGLPRPAVLHRVLQHVATLGVRRLDLVNAWRVEKSYFQSPAVQEEAIQRHLLLGAEQGGRTLLPEVRLHRLLVPFLEGLDSELQEAGASPRRRLLAHPRAERRLEEGLAGAGGPLLLAIGPEGGWIDREIETFAGRGFAAVTLGPWILRTEAAITAALAQVDLVRRWLGDPAPPTPEGPGGGGLLK